MKYIDEYRDRELVLKLAGKIKESAMQEYIFMEVCGGHTAAIHRFGIPDLLPGNIKLLSGPGCPVCVTDIGFIDKAIACSQMENVIIVTFGDLIRVPGSHSTLEKMNESGADIRIVFSAMEALEIARLNPQKRIVFLAIGFETTAPGTAVTIKQAEKDKIDNFYILCAHKIMPPAMEAIVSEGSPINGFICPGHVAAITGSSIFEFLPRKYNVACVVTGFEPADLMLSLLMLIHQVNNRKPEVAIQYKRAVTNMGNRSAKNYMNEVFTFCDTHWRGFGTIKESGLIPAGKYDKYNADNFMSYIPDYCEEDKNCICPQILRGLKQPAECPLFAKTCVPENPVGACMVSPEGACNTWYKYKVSL